MRVALTIVTLAFQIWAGPALAQGTELLELEDIFDSEELQSPNPEGLVWLPDGETLIYRLEEADETVLWRDNAASGEHTRVADWDAVLDGLRAQRPDYVKPPMRSEVNSANSGRSAQDLAPDGSSMVGLVAGDLYLFDLATGTARFLTQDPAPELFPTFSPDGRRVGFVKNGDLYTLDLATGTTHRLTDRGGKEHLLNGVADWVYEEELDVRRSFWWSPDGDRVAFIVYDTSPVGVFPITDELELYATLEQQRYPKAGTANSIVRLGVVTLDGGQPTWIDLGDDQDIYLPRAGWTPTGDRVWYQWMNRDQTTVELRFADPESGRSQTIVREHEPTWVNIRDDLVFVDGSRFVWGSERDGWRHLYLYRSDGALVRQLTSGEWQVEKVYEIAADTVFIQGTGSDPRERHVYAVRLDGGGTTRLTGDGGSHAATFAPGGRWWVDEHSDIRTPPRMDLMRASGDKVRTISDGAIPALDRYRLSPLELGSLTTDDGVTLYTAMIRPPDFDPSRRYPVLLYVYGGPHAQLVSDRWGGSRHLYYQLLAQRGLVVFWLDNRGTWARGKAFESVVHRRLGEWEVKDQLAGVRYLKSLPYIDGERIGVYGGSYGGYMTLMCMLTAPELFRAGIAYAPVTDWKLYDTVYTERYMDRPQDNPDGYRAGAPLTFADNLQGRLLLVHGTMDNNVHMQNTVQLVDKLAAADKGFELMVYPRVRHGVRRSSFRLHLHRLKTEFLFEHLVQDRPDTR